MVSLSPLRLLAEWMTCWWEDPNAPVKLPKSLHIRTVVALVTAGYRSSGEGGGDLEPVRIDSEDERRVGMTLRQRFARLLTELGPEGQESGVERMARSTLHSLIMELDEAVADYDREHRAAPGPAGPA